MTLIGTDQVDTAAVRSANILIAFLALVDVFTGAVREPKAFMTCAKISSWEILPTNNSSNRQSEPPQWVRTKRSEK